MIESIEHKIINEINQINTGLESVKMLMPNCMESTRVILNQNLKKIYAFISYYHSSPLNDAYKHIHSKQCAEWHLRYDYRGC